MSPLIALAILLYFAGAAIFSALAYLYGKTAISTRARYPFGLFIFSVLLVVQASGTAAAYFFLSPYFGNEALPFMSVMGAFELVGGVALLRITL